MRRTQWIADAFDLYRHTDGKLGPDYAVMSNVAVQAINIVSAGVAWREAEQLKSPPKKG